MTAQNRGPQAQQPAQQGGGPFVPAAQGRRSRALLFAAGLVLGTTAPAALLAQEAGGLQLTFGIDSRIASHSNLDLDADAQSSTLSDTRLDFGLQKVTGSGYLGLEIGTLLREQLGGSKTYEEGLLDPRVSLSFGHENSNAALSGGLFFRETDLKTTQELDEFDGNSGTRRNRGGNLSLLWGRDSRVTWRLGADVNYATFSDSPGNDNRRTLTYNGGATLMLNEAQSLDIGLIRSDYDPDNSESRVTDTITLNLRTDRADGVLGFGGSFSDTPDGNRESLSVSRDYELSSGTLSASVGVSRGVSGHTGMIGNLNYAQELPEGRLSLGLSRSLSSSDENDREVENTRASLSWLHDVNERLDVSMNLGLAKQSYTEEGAGDTDRMSAGLSTSYDLGQDWRATAGISHISRKEDGGTERDNSVYIGLRKTFERSY